MMTEGDRRKWDDDVENTRKAMFELVGKIENS